MYHNTQRFVHLGLCCVAVVATIVFSASAVTEPELNALRDIRDSLDPNNNILKWFMSPPDPCEGNSARWQSLECKNDSIIGFYLGYYGMVGTLPNSIGDLRNLTTIAVGGNSLTGTIPASLMQTKLETFTIENNKFESPLPVNFFGMPTLKKVVLYENLGLNETWPTLWSSSIIELQAGRVGFRGPIPATMANMTRIKLLNLAYNPSSLRGPVPSFLLNMTSLESLDLGADEIRPPLPDFCVLSNLTTLSLAINTLSIPVPDFSCLTKLERLYLGSCQLNGTVPSNLPSTLNVLFLDSNRLEGEFPSQYFTWPWKELDIGGNRLNGSIPDSIFNSTILTNLRFGGGNSFVGSIPEGVSPPILGSLDVSGNVGFTGSIPRSIGTWPELFSLNIAGSGINGTIPDSIGNLSSLSILILEDTEISGAAPTTMRQLRNLGVLQASNTRLSGSTLLEALTYIQGLLFVELSGCSLSGTIPERFGFNMTKLSRLLLDGNLLEGTIPASFSRMVDLKFLNLTNNNLNGTIPLSLTYSLRSLTSLSLESNSLTGCLDTSDSISSCTADSTLCGCTRANCGLQICPAQKSCFGSSPFTGAVCYNGVWIIPSSVIVQGTNITITSPTIVNGDLIILSANSTIALKTSASFNESVLTVDGCVALNGSLQVALNGSELAQTPGSLVLISHGGFCTQTGSRFSQLLLDTGCIKLTNAQLDYSSRSIALLFDGADASNCAVSSGLSPTTMYIIIGCSIGGFVLIVIIVVVVALKVPAVGNKLMPWRARRKAGGQRDEL